MPELDLHIWVEWLHMMTGGTILGLSIVFLIFAMNPKADHEGRASLLLWPFMTASYGLQFISGLTLVSIEDLSFSEHWIIGGLALLVLSGVLWHRAVKQLKKTTTHHMGLSLAATLMLPVIFFLMITKPSF